MNSKHRSELHTMFVHIQHDKREEFFQTLCDWVDSYADSCQREAIERAENAAKHTTFRAHFHYDVDYHSGCEQTRDRIVEAIRALKVNHE